SFPCQEHHVAGPGLADRRRDRRRSIEFDRIAAVSGVADAVDDVADDGAGILTAWVIAGYDDAIGQPRRHAAHFRPLTTVAIAAATEHAHELAAGADCGAQRSQHLVERVRGVRVVDDD